MQTALVPAIPLSNQLEIGKFNYTPNQQQFFGHVPEFHFPQLSIAYETSFKLSHNTPVELVIEPESIRGEWQIVINDQFVIKEQDFTISDAHVHGSLGVDITKMLQAGDNHMVIFVRANKPNQCLLNCIYLAGDFGVSLAPDCGREFNETTEITVNDSEFLPVLWQPRVIRIAAKTLRAGTNRMRIKVYTTLIRAFEGAYFDEESHFYRRLSSDE